MKHKEFDRKKSYASSENEKPSKEIDEKKTKDQVQKQPTKSKKRKGISKERTQSSREFAKNLKQNATKLKRQTSTKQPSAESGDEVQSVLTKVDLIPSKSVTFVPNEKRQQTYLVIRNGTNEPVLFKLKSTRPSAYKTKPVYGTVSAGEKFAVRLVFTGIKVGLRIPTNDRFTVVLARNPDGKTESTRLTWKKMMQNSADSIFPDAEMKKRKIKILFAGINDKMEEKDEDEDEKDKKTSKHPDAANEKKDVKGKKNDEKEKKGREPSRPKYGKHSGLKEKLPKALDSAKPDQKVSGESVAMEQAEPKKKDKDKFTEKAEKTYTKNGKEPEEKLDGIKPSEKALTGKDAKEQSQPKKDTEHLEKDKKEDKEEDVEQQHEAKMTGKPEIIVHKVEIDSDFTQKPEPVEHESGEGKDKEMDERDAAHPHHGAEAEKDEKHTEPAAVAAGQSHGTNVVAKTPGGSDPAATDPNLRKKELELLQKDGKKILVVTMFRDQKVPEEALSRSGDEDDEDEEEENPDADEAKASKPNM